MSKYKVNLWRNFLFFLVFLTACQSKNNIDRQGENINNCDIKNKLILTKDKVKNIDLQRESVTKSGIIKQGETIGYIFNAKAGDILQYKTDQDICVSIYTQKNDLVKDVKLPIDGLYTLQLYLPKGSQSFEINFSLNENKQLTNNNNRNDKISNYQWDLANYPQSSCGDEKPSDSSVYPIDFYPVNIPYDENYYNIVKESYCQDSFQKKDKITDEKIIQVASFLSKEKALSFAQFISEKIPTVNVGEPTKIYE